MEIIYTIKLLIKFLIAIFQINVFMIKTKENFVLILINEFFLDLTKKLSYLIMDFNNYNLRSVREIFCIEDKPANISLSNSAADKNEYPTFLKFDFNFSKYSTIKKDFYFQNNGNNSDINKNNSEIIKIIHKTIKLFQTINL